MHSKIQMQQHAIELENISMRFGGAEALKDVDFQLKVGEIRGLVGKNGAGKSTLMKIILGLHAPTSGRVKLFGKEISAAASTAEREEHISMIFQEFSLVPEMTVVQNIFLNVEPKNGLLINDEYCYKQVKTFFEELGLEIDPDEKVKNLSTSDMQMVEIAKAVIRNKKVLLMDEPTAALEADQAAKLFELTRKLQAKGITIILISHHLRDIIELCDSVTVLRDGKVTLSDEIANLSLNTIISRMLGDVAYSTQQREWRLIDREQRPLLEVQNATAKRKSSPISFAVYPGEVLGLAGLKGSGRTETFNMVFGVDPLQSGEIRLDGEHVSIKDPKTAIKNGITLIPENRHALGLSLSHSLYLNTQLPWLDKIRGFLLMNDRLGQRVVEDLVRQLHIKADSIFSKVSSLSGGNQQKVVIAKSLGAKPRVVLMDDPTYGVDIHAKTEIMKIVDSFTAAGNAVVLVSSELEELLLNCDRILIITNGVVTQEYADVLKGDLSEEELAAAIQA